MIEFTIFDKHTGKQTEFKLCLPWKYGTAESILMEWSFGDSWTDDLLALNDALTLFLADTFSAAELEFVACDWFDFWSSENIELGFCGYYINQKD